MYNHLMKKVVQKVVAGGIIFNEGKVLIVQREDGDDYGGLWEIPSGKRENFERTVDAVIREVKEETGLDVEADNPVGVFEFKVEKENETRDMTQISFLCKPVGKIEVKLSSEHQNFAWITKEELNNYNISQETKDNLLKAFQLIG